VIVYEPAQDIANWVAAQLGNEAPLVDAAIGYQVDGVLRAGVYFDTMTRNNIFAHIASEAPMLPRSLLTAVGKYVYKQLALERMTFAVPEDNARARSLVLALGSHLEARLRRACGDCDLLLYALWRDATPAVLLTNRATSPVLQGGEANVPQV
jgi:hypothetical protein